MKIELSEVTIILIQWALENYIMTERWNLGFGISELTDEEFIDFMKASDDFDRAVERAKVTK